MKRDWWELTDEERKNYPPEGKNCEPRSLADIIPTREQMWHRKREATWGNLRALVPIPATVS